MTNRSGFCFAGRLRGTACVAALLAGYGCSSGGSSFGGGSAGTTGAQGGSSTPSGDGTGGSTGVAGNTGSTGGSATGNGGSGSGAAGASGSGAAGTDTAGGGGTETGSGGSTASGAGGETGGSAGSGGGSGGQSDASARSDATATSGAGGSETVSDASVLPTCPKPVGQICHEFIANDNSRNQINYVNEFTGKGWTVNVGDTTANSPRTIEIVDNARAKTGKAILVSLNRGYGEFDLVDGTSLTKVLTFNNVTGASRLPDGTTALGIVNSIHFATATGTDIRNFAIPAGLELRAINRDPATGNFWFSLTETVYEVSPQGALLWSAFMGAGSKGYAVWWRQGGGAYATTGDPSTVVEIDANKTIISQVGGKAKFPFFDFFSGFVRLASGNYVVANWLGHIAAPAAATPHLVELTPANALVWQWGNQTLARQITNVYLFR